MARPFISLAFTQLGQSPLWFRNLRKFESAPLRSRVALALVRNGNFPCWIF